MNRSLVLIAATLLTACTTSLDVDVLRPPDVVVPEDVKTIAIIDRASPQNTGEEILAGIEGVLTGEGLLADKEARESMLWEVQDVLATSPRFEVLPGIDVVDSSIWDQDLTPSLAIDLCAERGCDAVLALEAFDSDSEVIDVSDLLAAEDELDAAGQVAWFILERETEVLSSWSLYDGRSGRVLDSLREYRLGNVFDAEGETFEAALAGLPDGRSVVKGLANDSGQDYAARIAPLWERVSRPLYGKGSPLLEEARDAVRSGDLGRAEDLWAEAARSASIDESGRALYNLAVAAESRGDLAAALDLATQADAKLRASRTTDYMLELRDLIRVRV